MSSARHSSPTGTPQSFIAFVMPGLWSGESATTSTPHRSLGTW